MSRLSPTTIAHILLLAVVLVWGATFALIKDALTDVSPLLFNLLRIISRCVVCGCQGRCVCVCVCVCVCGCVCVCVCV